MLWRYFLAVISAALIGFLTIAAKRLYYDSLAKYPGPKLWAISRVPYVWAMWSGKLAHRIRDFHEQYGPAIRVAPNELSFIESSACRDILARRLGQSAFAKNPIWIPPPSPNNPMNILNAPDHEHVRIRRALSYGFSEQSLKAQEPLITAEVDKLMEKLRSLASMEPGVVNIGAWFAYCIFDITGSLVFGTSYGCLDRGTYHESLLLAVFSIKASVVRAAFRYFPWLFNILMLTVGKSTQSKARKHVSYSQEKVRERLAHPTERRDILYHLQNGSRALSDAEIERNASTLITAGNHTISSTLLGTFTFLLRYPETLRRLTEEVRGAFQSTGDISLAGLSGLPYLSAVIEEGLRVVGPIPLGTPRVVPSPGATVCGEWIPGGTFVAYMQWGASLSPNHFLRPEEFSPERWLDPKIYPEALPFQHDRREAVQAFNLGPRDCIGRHLAYAELRLLLGKLVYEFDVELPAGPESVLKWEEQETFVVWQTSPFHVKLRESVC